MHRWIDSTPHISNPAVPGDNRPLSSRPSRTVNQVGRLEKRTTVHAFSSPASPLSTVSDGPASFPSHFPAFVVLSAQGAVCSRRAFAVPFRSLAGLAALLSTALRSTALRSARFTSPTAPSPPKSSTASQSDCPAACTGRRGTRRLLGSSACLVVKSE
jgi:hypothetical protein